MSFISKPIVIAAIAAGGTAVLVLVAAGSILLYRRSHPHLHTVPRTPSTAPSGKSPASGKNHATEYSATSSTRRSHNPYHTPTVPLVQLPPAPTRRRSPKEAHEHQRQLSDSPFGSALLHSPESQMLLTPGTAPGAGSKLRKPVVESPSVASATPSTPQCRKTPKAGLKSPYSPDTQQPMISPPPQPASRMSIDSSVIFITYEQGLARLGLSAVSRPLPTVSAPASTYGLTPSSAPISRSTTRTKTRNAPVLSTYSDHSDDSSPPHPDSPTSAPAIHPDRFRVEPERRGRGSFPMTATPVASDFGGREYGRPVIGREWNERKRDSSKTGRTGWLPSYYQPSGDRYKPESDSKSRWGTMI